MAHPRFFCDADLAPHTTIELSAPLAHHALRVLRLKPDSEIVLFDGSGGQYPARLRADGKRAYAELGHHVSIEAELRGDITLVQGIASGDKMDWIIEKTVELGVRRVVPIAARRSVLQLSGDRLQKRLDHWRRVAQAASEQCGRNRLMLVDEPQTLESYLSCALHTPVQTLFCHPGAPRTLTQAVASLQDRASILVGPEGGWSNEEQAAVETAGLAPVSFGPRILRTETAGLALVAAVTALKGWS